MVLPLSCAVGPTVLGIGKRAGLAWPMCIGLLLRFYHELDDVMSASEATIVSSDQGEGTEEFYELKRLSETVISGECG